METPGPGIYPNTPEHIYRAWDAVNQSVLKTIIGRTPAHAYHERLYPDGPSPSQEFGLAFHACILEPEKWEEEFAVPPVVDRRTKIGKAEWAAFLAEHEVDTHITRKQWDACSRMSQLCWEKKHVAAFLKGPGLNEVSFLWIDEKTGLLCKGRADRISAVDGWTVVGDFKSTRDAGPRSFYRDAAWRYRYDIQQAFYLEGLFQLEPRARRFWFIAVDGQKPYEPAVYELSDEDVDRGATDVREALDTYAACKESGRWPGYPDEVQILARDGAFTQGDFQ